jgi:hypothetical protein
MNRLSRDGCIALPDAELVHQVYEWISRIPPSSRNDMDVSEEALHFLADEVFERFVPELALADAERYYRDQWQDDPAFFANNPEDLNEEISAARDGIRERQATRMIRDAFKEHPDAS